MKTTFTFALLLIFLLPSSPGFATILAETGDIKGSVKDENGKPLAYANVVVLSTGYGASTEEDGSYTIRGLMPGTYDVQASFLGKNSSLKKGVGIEVNQTTYVDFSLTALSGKGVVIEAEFIKPIVSKTYSTVTTIPAEIATRMEHGNINGMITNMCSSCSETSDRQLVMRGARTGTVEYIVDGQRMFGTAEVPSQAIEQVTILSGGIPAEYGDLTGGVIIISTKNFISGMRESRLMREAILEPKKE